MVGPRAITPAGGGTKVKEGMKVKRKSDSGWTTRGIIASIAFVSSYSVIFIRLLDPSGRSIGALATVQE